MNRLANIWGVVPAAGVGKRMQSDRPKQYLQLAGKTVIEHTLMRLLEADVFTAVAVAVSKEDPYWPELPISEHRQILRAEGGKERCDSVLLALNALQDQANNDDWVLVHDAARPCITATDIRLLIDTLRQDVVGGILALPCNDTLKHVDQVSITDTIDRSKIWRALTPQMFRFKALKHALETAAARGEVVTDEASALELQGLRPKIVEGRPDNIKITRPEDLPLAQFYLEQQC
jgi:2-C-methyl-D-erythritol 4-phosphate cytidylyltransferase